MHIYYRVCEKQQTLSGVPRWNNMNKLEMIKKCWLSLQQSIDSEKDEIIIVEDECSDEMLDYLVAHSKAKITNIHHVAPHTDDSSHFVEVADIIDEKTKLFLNEIHFMCNDDFLFLSNALIIMKSVFEEGWDGFVIPYDYPDRYTLDKTRLCELYLSSYTHWRTIPACTSITSARGRIWQQHMQPFKRNAYFNDDSWTWEAYSFAKSKGICPIPGVATHLTRGCMTPLINWEKVWNDIKI